MMYIQGALQPVFDALYEMGKIDPALSEDWGKLENCMKHKPEKVKKVFEAVNSSQGDVPTLVKKLEAFDDESLLYLTMEVAREYVDSECNKIRH